MPSARFRRTTRRSSRRYPRSRVRPSNASSRLAVRLARRALGRLNTEFKYFDNIQTGANIPNTGNVYRLDAVPQGVGVSQRVGDQIRAKSLYIRLNLNGANNNEPTVRVRAIIVADYNTTGTPMALADLLVSADVDAFHNMYNRRRFRVFHDKIYILANQQNAAMLSGGIPSARYITKYFKIDQTKVYEAGGTDVQSGVAMYLILLSDDTAAYPDMPYADISTRIRYIDN